MRGRKPRPSWQRRLTGNAGKRAENRAEPDLPPPDPSFDNPPALLAAYPMAVEEWRRLAPLLRRNRQVTEADRSALIAVCIEWHRYHDALTKAQERPVIVTPAVIRLRKIPCGIFNLLIFFPMLIFAD